MCNKCDNDTCKCDVDIDWTKKLKFNNNSDFVIEVLGKEMRNDKMTIVKMYHPKSPASVYMGVYDRYGRNINNNDKWDRIENVHEEPYDTIMLYRYKNRKGPYGIDCQGKGKGPGIQIFQRSIAEGIKHTSNTYEYILVTVPPYKD